MRCIAVTLCFLVFAFSSSEAETLIFDFEAGPGPLFTPYNDGNLWQLDLDGPDLRISKQEDDLSFRPGGPIRGGIASTFPLVGDFTVTVDYYLHVFPADLSHSETYNIVELGLWETQDEWEGPQDHYVLIRFRQNTSQEIEGWHLPPGTIVGRQSVPGSLLSTGRLRVGRTGNIITSSYAPLGSDSFTSIGATAGSTVPLYIRIDATQHRTCTCVPDRANNARDTSFDNLIVEASALPVPVRGSTWGRVKSLYLD